MNNCRWGLPHTPNELHQNNQIFRNCDKVAISLAHCANFTVTIVTISRTLCVHIAMRKQCIGVVSDATTSARNIVPPRLRCVFVSRKNCKEKEVLLGLPFLAGETRLEHATDGFGDRCSTIEPLPYANLMLNHYSKHFVFSQWI